MQRPVREWRQTRVGVSPDVAASHVLASGEPDLGRSFAGAGPDFDSWVIANGSDLLRFGFLVLGDHHRAEEAVQKALVRVCGRWRRVSAADDPSAYVRRMMVNADISRWRKVGRREQPVEEIYPRKGAAAPSGTADPATAVTEVDAIWRLCAVLPRRQRAAVVLRYYEGLPDAEIAKILDCAEGTVRSQIHRALATLRAGLAEQERATMTDRTRPVDPVADDQIVAVLERTLATYAGQAPPAVGLPDRVRRTRRRRTLTRAGVGTGAALAVAAAIVVPMALGGGGGSVNPAAEPPDAGWRWETYRGLELQVPADWGYGTSGHPWCVPAGPTPAGPYVGRPGATFAIACAGDLAPVEQRVLYVWFGTAAFANVDAGDGWQLASVNVGSEPFTLLTNDAEVHQHIIDSARLVDVDANGCDVYHPIAKDPSVRPAAPGGLPEPAEVTGASVCQYTLSMVDTITDGPSLLASRRLDGSTAAALTEAIATAPEIGVRPQVETCSFMPAHGSDVVLVRFDAGDAIREVLVRTNGCPTGTDDGTTERELTDAVRAIVLDGPIVDGAGLGTW